MALKAESDGRMFPVTDSSQTIIDCLLKEVNKHAVQIRMNAEIKEIIIDSPGFRLQFAKGEQLSADFICVATGGYPKASMFEWLSALGHSYEEPVPSLFTFNLPTGQSGNAKHPITELMGVSVENALVKINGSKLQQEGPLLITHWGLSGPAILKLSAWGARELKSRNWEFGISVNWLPGYNEQQLADRFQTLRFELASQKIGSKNPFGLPQRLWEYLLDQSQVNKEKRWADLAVTGQHRLIQYLCRSTFEIKGKTTFKEEFVTAGGIKLNEIDPNTMMSKKVAGIFFAGEVMDVDGITGGFNFQHAWTSGFIAAKAIASLSVEG